MNRNFNYFVFKALFSGLCILALSSKALAMSNECSVSLEAHLYYDVNKSTLTASYSSASKEVSIESLSFPLFTKYLDYGFLQTANNDAALEAGGLVATSEESEDRALSLTWTDSPRIVRGLYFPFMPLADNGAILLESAVIPESVTFSRKGIRAPEEKLHRRCVQLVVDNDDFFVQKGAGDGYLFLAAQKLERELDESAVVFIKSTILPSWLEEVIERVSKQSHLYFQDELNELEKPFTLFAGYTENSSHGAFRDAGVIQGPHGFDLALRFVGAPYAQYDELAALDIAHLIAHEFFHAWNGGELALEGHAWAHEGSANYAAELYLKHSNVISSEEFEQRMRQSKIECLLGLGERDFVEDNSFFLHYTCGQAIWSSLLPEESSFFKFYTAQRKANSLDSTVPSQLVSSLAHHAELNASNLEFLMSSVSLNERYTQLFAVVNHKGNQNPLEEAVNQPGLARLVFQQIQAQLCRGRVNFSTHDDFIRFYQTEECPEVFSRETMEVVSLNTISVLSEQVDEFVGSYLRGCVKNGQFSLGLKSGETRAAECPLGHLSLAKAYMLL